MSGDLVELKVDFSIASSSGAQAGVKGAGAGHKTQSLEETVLIPYHAIKAHSVEHPRSAPAFPGQPFVCSWPQQNHPPIPQGNV